MADDESGGKPSDVTVGYLPVAIRMGSKRTFEAVGEAQDKGLPLPEIEKRRGPVVGMTRMKIVMPKPSEVDSYARFAVVPRCCQCRNYDRETYEARNRLPAAEATLIHEVYVAQNMVENMDLGVCKEKSSAKGLTLVAALAPKCEGFVPQSHVTSRAGRKDIIR